MFQADLANLATLQTPLRSHLVQSRSRHDDSSSEDEEFFDLVPPEPKQFAALQDVPPACKLLAHSQWAVRAAYHQAIQSCLSRALLLAWIGCVKLTVPATRRAMCDVACVANLYVADGMSY
ncbi:hypothetical protein BSKO_02433 [Bryopsis sp. KO-2023]|nr:hypothetical protein BSKO_02433 [Bryopsis sp. KO-2023]